MSTSIRRMTLPGLVLLAALACGDRAAAGAGLERGTPAAFAAARPWRFEATPTDTFPAVARRVWSGYQADLLVAPSPDGRQVALTDWMTGDMALVDLAATDTLRLTRNVAPYQPGFGMFPRFSRDGRQVAFGWWDAQRPASWQLRVVELADRPEARVIYDGSNTVWIQPEDWSPDGRWILAWRVLEDPVVQIVLVSSEGHSVRVLKTLDWRSPLRMNFSPDGRWILYDFPPDENTEQRDVYALAVDGSRESRLVQHSADDFVLGWAPDGSVLFMSDRTGTPGAWLLPVSNGRVAGPPKLVKPDMFQVWPIAFLEDGSYMYAIATGTRDVFVATLDPTDGSIVGAPVKVAARGTGIMQRPAWSPDGRHLAYVIQQAPVPGGPRRLVIRSLESGDVRELTLSNRLGYVQALQWSPDGSSLLLQARDEKGRHSVFRFDVQTSRSELLLQRSTEISMSQVELTPDGAALVINEEDVANEPMIERRIVVRDLRSGEERVLFRMTAGFDHQIRHLTLSPDGQQAAFVDWRGSGPQHNVMVMPLAGGEPRMVTSGRMISLSFGPDGRSLFFSEPVNENSFEATHRLMRVPVGGGEPEPVGVTMHDIQGIRVHAPSRRIAFTAGRPQAELWIMDNFLPRTDRVGTTSSGR